MALSKQRNSHAAVAEAVTHAAATWAADTRVCVALSGGMDSVVLLHALVALRDALHAPWTLSAHHVHHGLSPNADTWVAHCETVCASLAVPLTVDRVEVNRQARVGIEAAARMARYGSLDKTAASVVLLAQHARDQAETVLLQLLRGAGPAGLSAMPATPATPTYAAPATRYLRPLLGVPKAAISDYASAHALQWIEDESNADTRFARNRLRAQVWPALMQSFPSTELTLSRAAAHQAEAAALLEDLALLDAAHCVDKGALILPAFNSLSRARRANLLRHWLISHDVDAPATETLREWLRQLASLAPTQSICLPCADDNTSIRVYRDKAWVVHDVPRWHACPWLGESELILKGELGVSGRVTLIAHQGEPAIRTPTAGERWGLRPRQDGDAIELSARSGHVALKNIFQNAAVPPWQRERWPILTCNDKVVSLVGIATASAFTVCAGEQGFVCEWKPAVGARLPS